MGILCYTWDDVVVKGPCDFRWGNTTDSTGQQKSLSFVEGHVSRQLSEDRVSMNRQGHRPTVLSNCICGYAGITACIIRLVGTQGGDMRRVGACRKCKTSWVSIKKHAILVKDL